MDFLTHEVSSRESMRGQACPLVGATMLGLSQRGRTSADSFSSGRQGSMRRESPSLAEICFGFSGYPGRPKCPRCPRITVKIFCQRLCCSSCTRRDPIEQPRIDVRARFQRLILGCPLQRRLASHPHARSGPVPGRWARGWNGPSRPVTRCLGPGRSLDGRGGRRGPPWCRTGGRAHRRARWRLEPRP